MIRVSLGHGVAVAIGARHTYIIADRAVEIDGPISFLAAFASGTAGPPPRIAPAPGPGPEGGPLLYDAVAELGGAPRRVLCRLGAAAYWLDIESIGRFVVTRDGHHVARLEGMAGPQCPSTHEVLLGPCLSLAFALADTWCLHAGAIGDERGLVAFVGESGRGKSTLAAAADHRPARSRSATDHGPRWRRAADDVLPVTMNSDGSGVVGLPRFPQLKLPDGAQPGAALPDRVPLRAVYVLERTSCVASPRAEPLDGALAAAALVRHSVAARLFDGPLLERHLSFCSRAVIAVPVRRLFYPPGLGRLPEVLEYVGRDVEGLGT